MNHPVIFHPSLADIGIFTERELEVLKRTHMPDKNIAYDMDISKNTVNNYWDRIRLKTGHNTKIELAIYATFRGLYTDTHQVNCSA